MEIYTIKKQTATSIMLELSIAKLSADDQKKILGKHFKQIAIDGSLVFVQEEDFVFEINTLLYYELDPNYRLLKKGTYPLEIHQGKIQILLTLSRYC